MIKSASSCQNRRSFFSSTYELPPFSSRETVFFFSYAYKLPIFYPFCFDIHASDGGCRGPPQHSNLQTCQHSNLPTFQPCLNLHLTPAGSQKQSARAG